MSPITGMVIRTDGPQVTVRDEQGTEWRCVFRGRLRRDLAGATNPVAVGDRVEVHPVGPTEGVVERVLPRRSRLARRAVSGHDERHRRSRGARPPREQVLAANLDLAVIVVPAPPRPTVIDRYLELATGGGCAPLVCVNKIDLADPPAVDAATGGYRDAGVPVLLTSAVTGAGLPALREALSGRLVAFIGPSGAGKSTLLNALDPGLGVRTRALTSSGRGNHTTSWAAAYQVGDAVVVDTPGLREITFLPEDDGPGSAKDLFPEITALAADCRFRDCSHVHEPRCAVRAALAAGTLDPQVYRRYTRLARAGRV